MKIEIFNHRICVCALLTNKSVYAQKAAQKRGKNANMKKLACGLFQFENGLHWSNTNGYSTESMKDFVGCYLIDYST